MPTRLALTHFSLEELVIMRTLIAIFLLLVCTTVTFGASFDCTKATSHVERLICSNAELSKLDEQLAAAYTQGISTSKKSEFKSSQRRWLIEKRNSCADAPCIKNAYEARLHEMQSATPDSTKQDSVTGVWNSNIPGEELRTIQSGSHVRFELDLTSGEPAYNVGFMEGEFELQGNNGVFESTEYKNCKITFTIYPTKVVLNSAYDINCGFGHGVYAIGTFNLRSRETPALERDPRN